MTFIDLFLHHTKLYESPTSFWRWSAYTAIAATLRDNIYIQQGDRFLYPNLYTLILADSAVHRKGWPVQFSTDLVKEVNNTKVIAGRSSIQGILDEMAKGETDKFTGKMLVGGSTFLSAPELAAGIVNDPEAINILTDIYDFRKEYVSRLRGSGIFRIKNVCFTLLAASNDELLAGIYDSKAMYGGLLGRTCLVAPNEFRPANSLFAAGNVKEEYDRLVKLLAEISRLVGSCMISPLAQQAYEDWYTPFRESYKNKGDKSGIIGRIHTTILKVSMILAANELTLMVTERHMEEAKEQCLSLLPNYSKFLMSSGKSNIAEIAGILIEDIWKSPSGRISKKEILSRHFNLFDLEALEKCTATLTQAGLIKEEMADNGVIYSVTQQCIDKFQLENK